MTTELIHEKGGDTLRYAGFNFASGLYELRIPAGTKSWQVGVQTGNLPVPCSVLMSLDAAPDAARAQPVGSDYRTVLQRLWAGETLRSDSPANSGTLSVSQAAQSSDWRADRARRLFLQFDFGPHKCLSWQSHVTVSESTAGVDPELYARVQALVVKVGLVQSMYRLSGCTNNADFERKAIDSGVWPGLIEMVRLAEG